MINRIFIIACVVLAMSGCGRSGKTQRYEKNPDPESADSVIPTGTYILYCGQRAREVAEEAFGPSLRDGVCYSDSRLTRKADVVLALTAIFSRSQKSHYQKQY